MGPKNRPVDIVRRCALKRERMMMVVMMVDEGRSTSSRGDQVRGWGMEKKEVK